MIGGVEAKRIPDMYLPLRLFDCFGFGTASTFVPIVPTLRVERDGDLTVVFELALSGSGS